MPKKKTAPAIDTVCIEIPNDFTPEALDNLTKMIAAKEALIKKALAAEALPVEVDDEKVSFPWFAAELDGEHINAYAQFITCLAATAKNKKRVQTETKAIDNEKFRMRIFCIALGMIGPEYKLARALLGKNLRGNSAWSSGIDPRKVERDAAKAQATAETAQEAPATPTSEKKKPAGKKPAAAPKAEVLPTGENVAATE